MKAAVSKRQMLHSALVASTDVLAQAQASLDADEEVRSSRHGGSVETRVGGKEAIAAGDVMSQAVRACIEAEQACDKARALLDEPLTSSWLQDVSPDGTSDGGVTYAEVEERVVEEAQQAAAAAEEAVAHLTERLGQLRGLRAKLRSLLAAAEARFRRVSSIIADSDALSNTIGVDNAVQVASRALARARERLQSPLSSGYLLPGGGGRSDDSNNYASGGASRGGLAWDEEAVSEATGYVTVLESLANSALSNPPSKERGDIAIEDSVETIAGDGPTGRTHEPRASAPGTPSSLDSSQRTAQEALALALHWGDALRKQVVELQLMGDSSVAKATEAVEKAMSAVQDTGSGVQTRGALEALATELGRLEKVAEVAAEEKRAREAGFGAATKRLDRLLTTLAGLDENVQAAGEPLVSLTAEAMQRARDATSAAAMAASVALDAGETC